MGTLDSREFDRLKERNFRDYSEGHRHMYLSAISQIGAPAMIFEAGFGIGYGLKEMLKAGVVDYYVGCEPQVDSYNYTATSVAHEFPGAADRLTLIHAPFDERMADARGGIFEHVFCIEVIEHVPELFQVEFIARLRTMLKPGGTLWFSTPCIRRHPTEGVRTSEEWEAMLRAEFGYVEVDRSRWTYLYRCR